MAVAALLMAALGAVIGAGLASREEAQAQSETAAAAQLAMQRMVASIRGAPGLILPLPENPSTGHSESVRDVLAVILDPTLDRDRDGFADANNDEDFVDMDGDGTRDPDEPERIDEDPGRDGNRDFCPGICGVDDDGDGLVDEGNFKDDDEDGQHDEDPWNGVDDDGDGAVDEDPPGDANDDGQPGVAGADDDGDGQIDEGFKRDDDEDGASDEDWIDVVAYRLDGDALVERLPDLNASSGAQYTERPLAEGVTRFRVERIAPAPGDRALLVDLTLELESPTGRAVSVHTRVRVGGTP